MNASKPKSFDHSGQAAAALEELAELSDRAGIDLPGLEEGRKLIERSRRFVAERNARREDRNGARRRIANALVSGELDFDGAIREAVAAESLGDTGVLSRAVTLAEEIACTRAFADTGKAVDGNAVLADCRAASTETLAEIRDLRSTLKGITDAEAASKAGPAKAKAWSAYTSQLLPRWRAIHDLVKQLRSYHWITPLPPDLERFGRMRRPDLMQEDHKAAKRARRPLLDFLDPISDRWEPDGAPFTEAQARKFAQAIEVDHEREREEQAQFDPAAQAIRGAARERGKLAA